MPAKKRSKKKAGATRNSGHKSSSLSWMIMGLLVGLFVAFLVHLDKIPTKDGDGISISEQKKNNASKQSGLGKTTGKTTEKKVQPKNYPKEQQFDFYTVLPDREVDVLEHNGARISEQQKTANVQKSTAKTKVESSLLKKNANIDTPSAGLYQLQVGAFNDLKKADAMKARLAFLGVESNIQVIQNKGQKLYRVRVGPSTDSKKINQIKARLKSQNINTFVQKL